MNTIKTINQTENREYEVLVILYNNTKNVWTMTFDSMIDRIKGNIDLSERMIIHYLNKLIERKAIKKVAVILNDKDGYMIDSNIMGVLKIIKG